MKPALAISGLAAGYGATVILEDVSLELSAGRTLAVLGRNGVGKSTLLGSIMGFTTIHAGRVSVLGEAVDGMPAHRRNALGVGFVPQEREIFPSLTVTENLQVARRARGWPLSRVFELFPALAARRGALGGRLSGGEQQMLAIGRALVGGPKLLLLDEPMEGLAPIVVETLYEALMHIRDDAEMAIVLVEQHAQLALSLSQDAIILDRGRIVYQGASEALARDEAAQARLLGLERAEEAA